ncbi:RNA polymerase sigma-70 factor, ECF subfamily [Halobacillus karajensis]|uniref:RNA polymerase sigma factor n=2 Tax=Halobacillus karajensis TaxID=195088 RepID=A0A024P958_9BACI|nr:RNA polymerase sigma factor [Halobacillus karajensis]CDQ21448.1 RNA polymerase sigma factor SigM [Halobacillus karajensis]CDQ25383.1 RNA polymerase sigma factor SigM [Halobacillus karajensis]CDQ29707.1 RNA polymerase sigma factor SigM [Halobacillus karajensis]SEI07740.1 RNA polymerase sigma-70 factor, ECF subfamily [Halobacillus karajensis]
MYKQYYHRVFYTALKVTKNPCSAEDILQETFIKAYDKLEEIKDENKVGAWLSTIAHRKAIDLIRKEKRAVLLPIEEIPPSRTVEECSDVECICEQRCLEEDIKKRTLMLSPKLRAVFQLSYYKQLQEKEIAYNLKISPAAVKSRLHRARQMMKGTLEKDIQHSSTA